MTVETLGLAAHQAIDSWARVHSSLSATSCNCLTLSIFSASVSESVSHS